MKLLFYSPVDLRAGLGCERWHCDVTNSLTDQFGYEIQIVSGNIGIQRWSDDYLTKQLKKIRYERLEYLTIFSSLVPTFSVVNKLYKYFKWADTIHFIHGFAGQDLLMAFIKLITGKKVVVGHHAPILHSSVFHNWYMNNISRHVLKFFNAHMTLNKKDKKLLENWGIKNVHFIPSGIRIEKFLSLPRTSHRKLNFLSIGRYDTPQKGFDLAVRAIEMFNKKYPKNNAIFRFLGSGGSVIDDASSNNPNIINLGYKKYEEIPGIYKDSDIFLLSSREEPFGLILIEAWSSGIPVLGTKTEGPLDMLIPNKNGWFIQNISSQEILKGIEQTYHLWINTPQTLRNMVSFCRQTGQKFSIDITAARMRKLLRNHVE